MNRRHLVLTGLTIGLCFYVACGSVSKRMPHELNEMRTILTRDNPDDCRKYHYNFERQAPRLYTEGQHDSLLAVIEFIKTECGPASNLEVTRLLVLAGDGRFDDSLVGISTVPQMLRYRTQREFRMDWLRWEYLYGSAPTDNSHDRFVEFQTDLAKEVAADNEAELTARTLGHFYAGNFDTAFALVQDNAMRGTTLRRSYDEYIAFTKRTFPVRLHLAVTAGIWMPAENLDFIGNHPDFGFHLGAEGRRWRFDAVANYRFAPSKSDYTVLRDEQPVVTDAFNSWLVGGDIGYKFFESPAFSTDLFGGLGYDVIHSAEVDGHRLQHEALSASVGLRGRLFLGKTKSQYIGGMVRFTMADYANPGGTSLSGNTLTVSLIAGGVVHETLWQFFEKLNYKGNWRY